MIFLSFYKYYLVPRQFTHFTSLLNRILLSASFPSTWKITVIIPLLKPLKDPTLPLSYRRISLLSALSKILEKIMNSRLVWFLGANKIVSNSLYGYRRPLSLHGSLRSRDAQIYEAEASHANLYSVFFDMENTIYHICTILHQLGLRGPFPRLLQHYLQKRTFSVRAASPLLHPQPRKWYSSGFSTQRYPLLDRH